MWSTESNALARSKNTVQEFNPLSRLWRSFSWMSLTASSVEWYTIITYLTFQKRCTRIWPLYCKLKVLPLDILIQIEFGKTMYKFQKGLLPPVFDTYFSKPTHRYSTRFTSQNNLAMLRINTAQDKSRLRYIGPTVWLRIQQNIREAPSLKVFISLYRNYLIGNYSTSPDWVYWLNLFSLVMRTRTL